MAIQKLEQTNNGEDNLEILGDESINESTKNLKNQHEESPTGDFMVFGLYDISEVKVHDSGLKNVINLNYSLVIKSHGRARERFGKANVNIVERLINSIGVPGHRGKKHKIVTRWATGKYNKNSIQVLKAFKIIHEKTKKNPIQVLVDAIEKGSPMDEVTMIQYGGARYPQAVDTSPLRRVSLALRNIVHGAYDKSFNKKKKFSQALADELIATSNGSGESIAVSKKIELEKQADAAR
ncbi:MAG: 30S ribosomal protein S7 [Candidatus Pacearchaeota archaeon]